MNTAQRLVNTPRAGVLCGRGNGYSQTAQKMDSWVFTQAQGSTFPHVHGPMLKSPGCASGSCSPAMAPERCAWGWRRWASYGWPFNEEAKEALERRSWLYRSFFGVRTSFNRSFFRSRSVYFSLPVRWNDWSPAMPARDEP